jgi:hypothetical protein
VIGGRSEIRTHGGVAPTAVFKTAALNHSAILPSPAPRRARQARHPFTLPRRAPATPCRPLCAVNAISGFRPTNAHGPAPRYHRDPGEKPHASATGPARASPPRKTKMPLKTRHGPQCRHAQSRRLRRRPCRPRRRPRPDCRSHDSRCARRIRTRLCLAARSAQSGRSRTR